MSLNLQPIFFLNPRHGNISEFVAMNRKKKKGGARRGRGSGTKEVKWDEDDDEEVWKREDGEKQ